MPSSRRASASRRRVGRIASHLVAAPDDREQIAPRPTRRYQHAEPFDEPRVMPLPPLTSDLEQAKNDLTEYGMCLVKDAISPELLEQLREKFDAQVAAEERVLSDRFGRKFGKGKNALGNLTNKGAVFLELIDHEVVNELCGYVLGRSFLLSSETAHYYRGPENTPQPLHRDQGFVPADAPFAAVLNIFWMLDDFYPENGSTHVVPGSHRWPAEHLIKPPARETITELVAPAGSVFAWDGRVWHGSGVNVDGTARRTIDTVSTCCPPRPSSLPSYLDDKVANL
jgi:ectoine hydroxylase-related dioxygenase (phytanoyl-CoA dioxygenase family)